MTLILYLRYKDGPEQIYRLEGKLIKIGRPKEEWEPDLDLSPDLRVSRQHAQFFFDLGRWWVEDLNSKRGTWVNGRKVSPERPVPLVSGDELTIGETRVGVQFQTATSTPEELDDTDVIPGAIESRFVVEETESPRSVSEDTSLEIFSRIADITAQYQGEAMLKRFLEILQRTFPQADRGAIVLIEDDGEPVPRVFWPGTRAYVSFTYMREVLRTQSALLWNRDAMHVKSLQDTTSALFAPILCQDDVLGVIQISTTDLDSVFGEDELALLSVVAKTIGPAIKADSMSIVDFPSVFISYSHQNREIVDRLAADLRRHKVKVWFDERLRVGEDWREQLKIAINNADAFVLVMSPPAVKSEYVIWEMTTAQAVGKKIFPLMYDKCDQPATIEGLQYLEFDARNYDSSLQHLVRELKLLVRH